MYPPELVGPMKEDLTSVGFNEITNPDDVESIVKTEGTTLMVVNSWE